MLHRACLRRIGLGIESGVLFGVDQKAPDTAKAQLVGEHQATRSATGYQDFRSDAVFAIASGFGMDLQLVLP